MKAVILAAGRGTRIQSVSNGTPKCLLRFGSDTILDYQIRNLWEAGISDIAIVVGHAQELIRTHIAGRYPGERGLFEFIVNPRYQSTNNIYSLWMARQWVAGDPFLCSNADVLYHPNIVVPAVRTEADVSMIIDPEWRDETMKVIIRDGHIVRMNKAITQREFSGTYIGITTFSRPACALLFYKIGKLIDQGRVNEFFNVAVEHLIPHGIKIGYTSTEGLPWAEIDDPNDFLFAKGSVYPLIPPIGVNLEPHRQMAA